MPATRRFGSLELVLLLVVVAVAGGARAWYLCACAGNGSTDGPLQVQGPSPTLDGLPPGTELNGRAPPTEVDALVHNLKEHKWFGSLAPLSSSEEQTAHIAPGYPWLLSGLQLLPFDLGPLDRTARWLQCGLGTFTAAFYFLFVFWAFGNPVVALLAGLLCALHPYWIINTAELNDGVLASFLLAASLFFGQRGSLSGGAFSSLLFGLSLAGLALVRAELLPFGVVALLWFLLRCRTVSRGWICALLAFLGFANGLALWTFRNYKTFGDVIPIADSAYLHLWMGNNPRSTGGAQSEQVILETLAKATGTDTKRAAEEWGQLRQVERYDKMGCEVFEQIRSDPAAALKHRLGAIGCFVMGEQWYRSRQAWHATAAAGTEAPEWIKDSGPAWLYGSLFGMLALGALGWRWTAAWRPETTLLALATVWVPLPYILSHAETLAGPRLPLDGVLLCYAAFALVGLIPGIGRGLLQPSPAKNDN